MADEALVAGLEKVQVHGTQQTGNLKANEEEKGTVPEKLQCDSSESDDSGSEKDAPLVKGASQGGKKKKLPKKMKKKATNKNKGEASTVDKLQCDSSDSKSDSGSSKSKSGSGDDSSNSKSGSGDDSKSESGSSNKNLEAELKQIEKKKGLIEKIREKLSRKPKEETVGVSREEISEAKEKDKQNLDKFHCDGFESKSDCTGDSGSKSCSANEKDTSVLKVGNKGEKKKKMLRKKIKKKASKKNEGEASTDGKLHCDSDSKSGSGDDSSGSKSGSGDDSGDSKSGSGDDSKSGVGPTVRAKKDKNGEEDQSATQLVAVPDTKVDEAIATENSEVIQEIKEDQSAGKEVKDDEATAQGEKEKKSILGKIMEKLPGYYKNGGE